MPGRLTFLTTADGASTPTERLRIDSSGRLLLGTTSLISSSVAANFQVASDFGPRINIARSDTTTAADNLIGAFDFYGNDSNGTYQNCARILAEADLDHGTDDKPTRLTFYTTPDGSATPTERLRIASSGEVQIANGNLKFSTSGTGIDFSATSDGGGMTSELLDDYEEGTFTPTAFLGTTAQTVTTATGTYTKVGNTVFFSCRLEGITKSGTGELSIGGLPYTPLFTGNANKYNQPTVRYAGINPGGVLVPLFSPTGSRFIFFQGISTSGVLGSITDSAASSTYNIYGLSGFYTV